MANPSQLQERFGGFPDFGVAHPNRPQGGFGHGFYQLSSTHIIDYQNTDVFVAIPSNVPAGTLQGARQYAASEFNLLASSPGNRKMSYSESGRAMLADEDAHQTKATDEHIRMLNFMETTQAVAVGRGPQVAAPKLVSSAIPPVGSGGGGTSQFVASGNSSPSKKAVKRTMEAAPQNAAKRPGNTSWMRPNPPKPPAPVIHLGSMQQQQSGGGGGGDDVQQTGGGQQPSVEFCCLF